jgi:hypothetical protein
MKEIPRVFVLLLMLSCVVSHTLTAQTVQSLGTSIDMKIKSEKNLEKPLNTTLIVAAGALPFAIFYTDFAFDVYRFINKGFDVQYAPWPLKNQYSASLSTGEKFIRVGVAIGVAATIGLLSITIPYH